MLDGAAEVRSRGVDGRFEVMTRHAGRPWIVVLEPDPEGRTRVRGNRLPPGPEMSAFSLQVTYRKGRSFAAYIYLHAGPGKTSARTDRVSPEVLIDFSADGTPLGIEIVSPQRVSFDEINEAFDRIGLARPEPSELEPLRAA